MISSAAAARRVGTGSKKMMTAILKTGSALLLAGLAFGQGVDKSLTFDAASVKPASPPVPDGRGRIMIAGPSGGPGSKDPGRIRYPFMSLKNLIMNAYDVKAYQVTGPAFLDTERFDVTATMPPDTTKEQFRVMLQNLLAERFKLTVHMDSKELPMYSLVVMKGGPKMKESAPPDPAKQADGDTPPPPLPNGPPKMGPDGFPVIPGLAGRGGVFMMMMPGRARLMAQQATVKDLADRLTQQLGKPVTDATELTAKYDFTLTFSPEGLSGGPLGPVGPPPGGGGGGVAVAINDGGRGGPGPNQSDAEAPPDIFHAIQAQLGLRLDQKKGPVEIVVVDHIEKTPTEN
jgi:uncharacterized protein (TIGR03435 family)